MTSASETAASPLGPVTDRALPTPLDRRFEAIIFDWDGTAVPDRTSDASAARNLIEALCGTGMNLAVVSGTHVENVDGQLRARPSGPGRLALLLNRGSEVFLVDKMGPQLLERRSATPKEEAALSAAAQLSVERLAGCGLEARIVSQRLNRRKIDLIPLPEWQEPPKARIAELLAAVEARLHSVGIEGLPHVVSLVRQAAAECGLPQARVTSDAKHVEIGLTDKSDSARWMLADLWRRGIAPGLVMIVGDELGPLGGLPGSDSLMLVDEARRSVAASVGVEPGGVPERVIALGGGPEAFLSILHDQLRRRAEGEVPEVDEDPTWTIAVDGFDESLNRVHDAQLSLADGVIGTSGSPILEHPAVSPRVLVAGVYRGEGPEAELMPAPLWNRLDLSLAAEHHLRRVLDMRTGTLRQEVSSPGRALLSTEFVCLERPGTAVLRAAGPAAMVPEGPALVADRHQIVGEGHAGATRWIEIGDGSAGIVTAATESRLAHDGVGVLDRFAVHVGGSGERPNPETVIERLRAVEMLGFESLFSEQRAAWAARWDEADVRIEGDEALQKAVRFALYHLIGSARDTEEAIVAARGLTGPAYRGHVFWDADVFVLPFLAATHPAAARAMLEYRIRRLPAARAAAQRLGRKGARFPWESAGGGEDVTPRITRDRSGKRIRILTGKLEEHITADVAWAASCYADWTGDEEFMAGSGGELIVEAARYWATRIRTGPDGRGHIYGVVGPDEYHGPVDDNAFTNVMARWNLRKAAQVAEAYRPDAKAEIDNWLRLADLLVDRFDPETGLYEQFTGFFDLEPIIIAAVAPRRPIAADVWMGAERVQSTQVIKQADVLMLHHLIPNEVAPGSLEANLRFYEIRSAHGSSLSPGIHASLLARAGGSDEAAAALRLTSLIDLDDLTGTTAGGLHLASMGSLWQALVFGFAGIRPSGSALEIDPKLPDNWSSLENHVVFRGNRLAVRADKRGVTIRTEKSLAVQIFGRPPKTVGPGEVRFDISATPRKEVA